MSHRNARTTFNGRLLIVQEGKPAVLAMPNRLVQLAFEADRSFTY